MTESMIERVAKAIEDKVPFGYGMSRREAREYAIAAVRALRDSLTPKLADMIFEDRCMMDWESDPAYADEWYGNYADFESGWRSAFDSVLSDTEERG